MKTTLTDVEETLLKKLGEVTGLFMSNPQLGTTQVMPAKEVEAISKEIMEEIRAYGLAQRTSEVQEADVRLKNEFGEDWLEFRDTRLKELDEYTTGK